MDNKIAELRKEKNIAQSYLVENLGVSRQTISSIENGHQTPSLQLALDMANLLGVPVEDLFSYEGRFTREYNVKDFNSEIKKGGK